MMNYLRVLIIPLLVMSLSGCVGLIAAGAATAVYVVMDPRTSGELLNDQDIALQADAMGNKPPFSKNVRVTASSFRGNVLLMGQAVSEQYRSDIEAQVRQIKGVKIVYNQMKVKPLLSVTDVSKDAWITTKVKSALIADDELRSIKISVYTEDKEVFLLGAVSELHADKAVEIARHISGVEKVIKAFYYGDQAQPAAAANEPETSQPSPADIEEIPYIEPIEVN